MTNNIKGRILSFFAPDKRESKPVHDRFIEPKVFLIAETRVVPDGMDEFFLEQGVPEWDTDAASDAEYLTEVAGKLCYQSFSTDLNKNLTRVGARNNLDYIQEGLISTKHGSVLEHANVTFVLYNVSRVLTHELIRHRPGAAYSQVSGRYVRSDRINAYLPSVLVSKPEGMQVFADTFSIMEQQVRKLEDIYGINEMTGREQFALKKVLTSAFRRIIGNGQANHIMASFNLRALRHVIENRTSRHAEEEIRLVFCKVFDLVERRYPAVFADAQIEIVDGLREITFKHSKV